METDLSLNGHNLIGSVHRINGILETKNGNKFLLNACDEIIMNQNDKILNIKLMYVKNKRQYTAISLKMIFLTPLPIPILYTPTKLSMNFNSTETTKIQTINVDHLVVNNCSMSIEINSVAKDEKFLMSLEYI